MVWAWMPWESDAREHGFFYGLDALTGNMDVFAHGSYYGLGIPKPTKNTIAMKPVKIAGNHGSIASGGCKSHHVLQLGLHSGAFATVGLQTKGRHAPVVLNTATLSLNYPP